ncbi:hypothetical protein SLA2020_154700 [Shorea laevis]
MSFPKLIEIRRNMSKLVKSKSRFEKRKPKSAWKCLEERRTVVSRKAMEETPRGNEEDEVNWEKEYTCMMMSSGSKSRYDRPLKVNGSRR